MLEVAFWIVLSIILAPTIVYLCVKYGTVGYGKGKEFLDKHKKLDTRTFKDFDNNDK